MFVGLNPAVVDLMSDQLRQNLLAARAQLSSNQHEADKVIRLNPTVIDLMSDQLNQNSIAPNRIIIKHVAS